MADEVHGQLRKTDTEQGRYEEEKHFCEPCLAGDIKKPADGWCDICDELFCTDCYQSHCRLKAMRNHQLKALDDRKARKQLNQVETKCNTHTGEPLKYFCEDHKELGCSDCFVDKHRKCDNIVSLSGIRVKEMEEFKTLENGLLQLEQRLGMNMENILSNMDLAYNQHDVVIANIKEAESHLKVFIEKLVQEKIEEANKIRDTNLENMESLQSKHRELSASLAANKELLRQYTVYGNEQELFIAIKTVQAAIENVDIQLNKAEKMKGVDELKFVLNMSLNKILTEVEEFGNFDVLRQHSLAKQSVKSAKLFVLHRFQEMSEVRYVYTWRRTDAIYVTIDQTIRLLYVLLCPCSVVVKLNISEDGHDLVQCNSTPSSSGGDLVPVKVQQDNGDHGITLIAGHTYSVCTTIEGGGYTRSFCVGNGKAEVTAGGVKFTFAKHSHSTVDVIAGLSFVLAQY